MNSHNKTVQLKGNVALTCITASSMHIATLDNIYSGTNCTMYSNSAGYFKSQYSFKALLYMVLVEQEMIPLLLVCSNPQLKQETMLIFTTRGSEYQSSIGMGNNG